MCLGVGQVHGLGCMDELLEIPVNRRGTALDLCKKMVQGADGQKLTSLLKVEGEKESLGLGWGQPKPIFPSWQMSTQLLSNILDFFILRDSQSQH